MIHDNTGHIRSRRNWLVTSPLILLLIACLALVIFNAVPGFPADRGRMHYRLVNILTRCDRQPGGLCGDLFLEKPHWNIWLVGKRCTQEYGCGDAYYNKLISIPLWSHIRISEPNTLHPAE